MSTLPDLTTAPPWWNVPIEPTRSEIAHWLAATSDANRDAWFDRQRADREAAATCWEHMHAETIQRLTAENRQLHERVRWLEKNYQPSGPAGLAFADTLPRPGHGDPGTDTKGPRG